MAKCSNRTPTIRSVEGLHRLARTVSSLFQLLIRNDSFSAMQTSVPKHQLFEGIRSSGGGAMSHARKSILLVAFVALIFSIVGSTAAAQGWSNGYANRRSVTIDHTRVPNTDQSNFPVLFSGTYTYLATTSHGGDVTNANGYDIIFTSDAAGTQVLPFEQQSYNGSTG